MADRQPVLRSRSHATRRPQGSRSSLPRPQPFPQSEQLLYLRNILWRFGARPVIATNAKRDSTEPACALSNAPGSSSSSGRPGAGLHRTRRSERSLCTANKTPCAVRHCVARATRRATAASRRSMSGRCAPRLDHPLVAMELEETFEQSRRLDMRILPPYWDAELVRFLYRTPPD